MKQLHINNIELNKTYYAVCCGNISEIQFLSINAPKCVTYSSKIDFKDEQYLSDIGVDYPNAIYQNQLNIITETYEEAKQIINDPFYKKRLAEHNEFWKDVLNENYF